MIVCSQVPELRPVAILLSREGLPDPEAKALGDKAEAEDAELER